MDVDTMTRSACRSWLRDRGERFPVKTRIGELRDAVRSLMGDEVNTYNPRRPSAQAYADSRR